MNKKFTNALRKDIKVRARGRKIEVSESGTTRPLTYRVDQRGANAETAAAINSRMPIATFHFHRP